MGYLELDGEDQAQAQVDLESVLRRQNAVKMIIYDPNQEQVVRDAKKIADEEPDLRWVVWVRNVDLLTDGQKGKFCKEDKVLCALSRKSTPAKWLDADFAAIKFQLRNAFAEAESMSG